MFTIPIRPRRLRLLLAATVAGAALAAPAVARADKLDTDVYVLLYGDVVCSVIDSYPSAGGVAGIIKDITDEGYSAADTAEIINQSVLTDCPRHWPLLVQIGNAARHAQGQRSA